MRLDRWFRVHFPEITYGHLQKLLRSGQVRLDSRRAQANARVESGQQVRVPAVLRLPPKTKPSLTPPLGLSKGDRDFIEAMILYEDQDVLVLNKPYGMVLESLGKNGSSIAAIMREKEAQTDPQQQVKESIGSGPFVFAKDQWVPGSKAVYFKTSSRAYLVPTISRYFRRS